MGKTLHVGNLSSSTTDDELLLMFARFGDVESAIVTRDAQTGRSKGFGIVEMASVTAAATAISRLNFTQNDGLIMGVSLIRQK